jgi:hypothetical protein
MTAPGARAAEILIALLAIVLSGAFLVDGRKLGPGVFEPIGSGAVPGGVAWITIALAALALVQAVRPRRQETQGIQETQGLPEHGLRAVLVFAWTCLYALVLSSGMVRYQWATLLFLPVAILIASDDRRAALPYAAGLGAVLAFGLDYVFRRLLVADIP